MNLDIIKLLPYGWRAFQQRARLGLLADDLEAFYEAAKPLIAEITRRWPAMNILGRTALAYIVPEYKTQILAGQQLWEPDLRWAQQELNLRGLYDGPIDGKNGPQTVAAITEFQRQAGFDERNVDGLFGPVTAGAMLASPAKG